ncbi:unnamed protein product [Adineta steineri]|uniref:Uncharacterized protein n=1 Tax=Adineta steineri TaxID=433720 RepID=A0A818KQR5_9BILA|nr:unnamed protein product [Adineta steineri]
MKLLKEQTIIDSFVDLSMYNEMEMFPDRFESSDVILSRDGHVMYVVFDNMYNIGVICTSLGRSFNCTDELLEWPQSSLKNKKSSFEGIAYNPRSETYFVVQEAIPTDNKKIFQANVFEISINQKDSIPVRIIESCLINHDFDTQNKGFEGLEFVLHQKSKKSYLLALCEANQCNHKSTTDNNGRVVVLEKTKSTSKSTCVWQPVGTFDLPSSVHFDDYSAISIYHQPSYKLPTHVAVTSQENSQVWIGTIEEINKAPFFQFSSLNKDTVYNLPRTTEMASECQIKYCNIEGVTWRGKNQLILVSDKAKTDQDIHCIEKDQSLHYLGLPKHLTD